MTVDKPEMPGTEDPHARLERTFINEYLRERGYDPHKLHELPAATVKQLLTEASQYASAKLTEVESRANFVTEVHGGPAPL